MTPSIVTSPPVIAASPMKLPTSMWSGPIFHSAPCSDSTPVIRKTLDSMPSICAPSATRKRQRSCTCGSQAALPITVSPGVSAAAINAFSVAMTLASSRKMLRPRSRAGSHLVAAADLDLRSELARTRGCADRAAAGRSRRRPAAARSLRRAARAAGRRAGTTLASGCRAPRRAPTSSPRRRERARRSVRSTRPRRRCRSAAPASSRRRRMRGTLRSNTGSGVSRQAARIGRAPFLLPAAWIRPCSGRPPSMTKHSAARPMTAVWDIAVAYPCRGNDTRAGLGDADEVHAERGSPPPCAGRRGVDRLVRAPLRRGRRALAHRLRCSTTSTTRSTPRSTSIRRTARRSCARRATRRS